MARLCIHEDFVLTVSRLKEELNVSIRIPPDLEKSDIVRIEGSPEGVAAAKKQLQEMVHKMVRYQIKLMLKIVLQFDVTWRMKDRRMGILNSNRK